MAQSDWPESWSFPGVAPAGQSYRDGYEQYTSVRLPSPS